MARDRLAPFLKMVQQACAENDVLSVIEAIRIFGYVSEDEYSKLTTKWTRMSNAARIRTDGAVTIELARLGLTPLNMHDSGTDDPEEIPGMIPREP
jgi:hypothetical protein